MVDEIPGPWIKKALLSYSQDEDPGRQKLQIVQVDKDGRPSVLSDKTHYISAIFEDGPVKRCLEKYSGAPSLKGAVMMPMAFTFHQEMQKRKMVLHVTNFKIYGSICSNVFGNPKDVHQDQEVKALLGKLANPITGIEAAKAIPFSQTQDEDELYRENMIRCIANDIALTEKKAKQEKQKPKNKQTRIFSQENLTETQFSEDVLKDLENMEMESSQQIPDGQPDTQDALASFYNLRSRTQATGQESLEVEETPKEAVDDNANDSNEKKLVKEKEKTGARVQRTIASSQRPLNFSPEDVTEEEEEEKEEEVVPGTQNQGGDGDSKPNMLSSEIKRSQGSSNTDGSSLNIKESQPTSSKKPLPNVPIVAETPESRQQPPGTPSPPREKIPSLAQLSQFAHAAEEDDEEAAGLSSHGKKDIDRAAAPNERTSREKGNRLQSGARKKEETSDALEKEHIFPGQVILVRTKLKNWWPAVVWDVEQLPAKDRAKWDKLKRQDLVPIRVFGRGSRFYMKSSTELREFESKYEAAGSEGKRAVRLASQFKKRYSKGKSSDIEELFETLCSSKPRKQLKSIVDAELKSPLGKRPKHREDDLRLVFVENTDSANPKRRRKQELLLFSKRILDRLEACEGWVLPDVAGLPTSEQIAGGWLLECD